MRRIALVASLACFIALASAPAHAQNLRTYVSNIGDDVNCTQVAPCRTFSGAQAKTTPTGVITCLNPGGYGHVMINRAITISCEGQTGGVVGASLGISAGSSDHVVLKGLDIDATLPTNAPGIQFFSGASLLVENTRIRNFGNGIAFTPSNSAKLTVVDSILSHNGDATTNSGGIQISPAGS